MINLTLRPLTPTSGGEVAVDPDDVRLGVDNGAGQSGTIVLPAVNKVAENTGFGANGTEFEGTMPTVVTQSFTPGNTFIETLLNKAFGNKLVPGITVAIPVVVKLKGTKAYDTETGNVTTTYTNVNANGIVRTLTAQEVLHSDGAYIKGDLSVRIRKSTDIPDITSDDLILVNSQPHRIISIETKIINGDSAFFACVCRSI